MIATVAAVLLVMVTLVVYQVSVERWESTAISRRQLDAWAVLSSLLALALILYGGSQAERERAAGASSAAPPARPALLRGAERDGGEPQAPQPDPRASAATLPEPTPASLAPDPAPPEVVVAAADPAADPAAPVEAPEGDGQAPRDDLATEVAPPATAAAPSGRPAPIGDPATPSPQAPPDDVILVPAPSATARPAVPTAGSRPRPPTVVPISPTEIPTDQPPPPPVQQPEPICGDPREMRLSLRIQEAQAERGDDGQVVRYRAEIENGSAFPLVAGGIVAVAQDGRSSADQFGFERLPDAQIEALHTLSLQGTIVLTRHPSPMSRSELCISFVAETCGRRGDDLLTRRCFEIDGF
jgi:hypothetical protein